MNDIIKLVLSLSLSGSILALLVLILKPLIKNKVSKSMQHMLWIVVILRFLIPLSFESSIINELFYGSDKISSYVSSKHIEIQNADQIDKNLDSSNHDYSKDSNNLKNTEYLSEWSNQYDSSSGTVLSRFYGNMAHTKTSRWEYLTRYLMYLFDRYAMYVWIFGALTFFILNLIGYLRFINKIKMANKPAADDQNQLLNSLLNIGHKLKLFRNPNIETPMLIDIVRPMVIIPDKEFSKRQLKYIFLHEINHMKRFDIAIKWLTMITQSIHWFNPLIYLVGREINHVCELACDEAVIKDLSAKEKQDYGDTLIDIASCDSYHLGALQATMYEDKRSLKDRLTAIMNHGKRSKAIIILSVTLFISVVAGALYLGAGIGKGATPPNIYISAEYEETRTAVIGTYSWNSVIADSISPIKMKYKPENVVNVSSRQHLSISTQKFETDRKYDFSLKSLNVFKDGKKVQFEAPDPSIMNGGLYCQAPADSGEYIYEVVLDFDNKGQVTYSFVVRVDMVVYDLNFISQLRTPYVGDAPKVWDLVQSLPPPEKSFKQHYISLETEKKPYGLTAFYEPKYDGTYVSEWPLIKKDEGSYSNVEKNALVLFCMIDNVDNVTFAFRNSPSDGKLDESKYDSKFTFLRSDFEERYGDLNLLGKDIQRLREVLEGKNIDVELENSPWLIDDQEY